MDCRHLAFSAEKSQTRIRRVSQMVLRKPPMRISAFALHLLEARRKEAAALVDMPRERTTLDDSKPDSRASSVTPSYCEVGDPPKNVESCIKSSNRYPTRRDADVLRSASAANPPACNTCCHQSSSLRSRALSGRSDRANSRTSCS